MILVEVSWPPKQSISRKTIMKKKNELEKIQ